jgi:hypothetical protein
LAPHSRRSHAVAVKASLATAAVLLLGLAPGVAHATTNTVTVAAHDLGSNAPLSHFTFIVNEDNTGIPDDPNLNNRPSIKPTESHSPLVAEGDQNHATVSLPDGRYLISIRSPDHKMWGRHITLPQDAGNVDIGLRGGPFPLGKIKVFVFDDSHHTNGAPDAGEVGLQGFHVTIEEQTNSLVTVDYFNQPLCGGDCVTNAEGGVTLTNLGPATYFVYVTPPATGCGPGGTGNWVQTSTFDGGFGVQAGVSEGGDGTGAPGEAVFEPPNVRTADFFGFVCTATDFPHPGNGTINGRALNWIGWPPFDILTADASEPVRNAYLALSRNSTNDTEWVGQADGAGNFSIPNVPPGDYTLAIWDEQLSYIIRFIPVSVAAGQAVDLGNQGVSRWFGWLGGYVYMDENNNGIRDCTNPQDPTTCEPAVANSEMDQRWRDGSIKETTRTDPSGYYEYPTAEGGPLGKWIINEQGFARFSAFPGPSVHNEINPSQVTPVPTDLGGGLLSNQLLTEGHRATVDWGKQRYPANTPGQIVGITYFATTRNEFDARFQKHEDYEPAIPGVTVRLEGLGPDNKPGTADDPVLNEYVTDHWSQPTGCTMTDQNGADLSTILNPLIATRCLEVPISGTQTKDGAFDGGYAFSDYCPAAIGGFGHFNAAGDAVCANGSAPVPLIAGTYITHAIMPTDSADNRPCNPDNTNGFKAVSGPVGDAGRKGCLYRPVREEDVNVDLGNQFVPAIPPPPCTGDMRTIDQSTLTSRSVYFGVNPSPQRPLCDKRLVVLENRQNANADFHLMTNQANGIDVESPGRIVGLVSDDIYFDRDKQSIWYGEPRPVPNIPIGIRDYAGRLIATTKTDNNGSYEILLPSTETFNCPIPQGPCPGMYLVVVDDPGDKAHPNPNYNPNYLTAQLAWDVWPGKTTQLDTPLDPISGTGCELSTTTPELLQVSKAVVRSTDTSAGSRRITIDGDFFGPNPGTVRLSDPRGNPQSRTLGPNLTPNPSASAGGLVSWTNRQIVIQVPGTNNFPAGQKQLTISTAPSAGATPSVNGLTLHVLGSGYNPPHVVSVPPPKNLVTGVENPHAIQNAIDAASPGDLLLLDYGTYHENLVMSKPLILQGHGPGGIVGASELQQRQPDDPRFDLTGTTIDGRFFNDATVHSDWTALVNALTPSLAGVDPSHPVLEGADIVAVAKSTNAYNISAAPAGVFSAARIDGLGLMTANAAKGGAGGIQLQAYARNVQVTNNILDSNAGFWVGGIGVGQPDFDAHNTNVTIRNNRVLGSGGLTKAGGIGIFRGSDNYNIQSNIVCGNFGIEYMTVGGISHWGPSPGGKIRDNQIYYNDSVGSGGGIGISHEVLPGGGLGGSSGAVDIDRNLLQGNYSGDGGGGMFVADAHTDRINVRNNMIVDNGAADMGGAVKLENSANVAFINNTVAHNVSTASAKTSNTTPHAAGLASEANDQLFQDTLPGGAPHFSNPVAFFNNIFWQNQAFTLSSPGPGSTLVDHGFIDLEIRGTTNHSDTFTPRYSMLTANSIVRGDGVADTLPAGQNNLFGVDPLFVSPFLLELSVTGSRQDPQAAAVTIVQADPPVGLPGHDHQQPTSPAIDRGAAYSNYPGPLNTATGSTLAPCSVTASPQPFGADFDRQPRPAIRNFFRLMTPWDIGADEVPGFFNIPVLPWSCGGTT